MISNNLDKLILVSLFLCITPNIGVHSAQQVSMADVDIEFEMYRKLQDKILNRNKYKQTKGNDVTGKIVTTIDLGSSEKTKKLELTEIEFNYHKPIKKLEIKKENGIIKAYKVYSDNKKDKKSKKAVSKKYGRISNYILVNGEKYKFKGMEIYSPSAHSINGERMPVEILFLHQNKESLKWAIVGVFAITSEKMLKQLQLILDNVPQKDGEKKQLSFAGLRLDKLIPKQTKRAYLGYRYQGSFISMPKSKEKVEWIIFQEPMHMTKEQLRQIQRLNIQ